MKRARNEDCGLALCTVALILCNDTVLYCIASFCKSVVMFLHILLQKFVILLLELSKLLVKHYVSSVFSNFDEN